MRLLVPAADHRSLSSIGLPEKDPHFVSFCFYYGTFKSKLLRTRFSRMVDINTVRSNWHSRGFSCDVWTDPPGQTWEDYKHSVDEVVMILQGDVEFEIGSQVLRPAVGEEVLIPAGVVHSVRNTGNNTSRWLYGYKTSSASL
jgi:mannose-6-phosphate isomerase-like protein (cupin superfamily)